MSLPPSANPLFRKLQAMPVIAPDAPFHFACRGCGQHCCVDQEILLAPPEFWRMAWHLQRTGLVKHGWAEIFPGGSSGLPVAQIVFRREDRRTICPFAATAYESSPSGGRRRVKGLQFCAIREARPAPCRVYPLARAYSLDPKTGAKEVEYRQAIQACPGFTPAAPGEPTAPGYAPAPEGQTAESWLAGQTRTDLDDERQTYAHIVLPAFMAAHAHLATADQPEGRLPEGLVVRVLGTLFYSAGPAPDDPAGDHAAVMQRLLRLAEVAPELGKRLAEARGAPASLTAPAAAYA